jgi:hypothetical protein
VCENRILQLTFDGLNLKGLLLLLTYSRVYMPTFCYLDDAFASNGLSVGGSAQYNVGGAQRAVSRYLQSPAEYLLNCN